MPFLTWLPSPDAAAGPARRTRVYGWEHTVTTDQAEVGVFLGVFLEVNWWQARTPHRGPGRAGTRLYDRALPNDEARRPAVIDQATAPRHDVGRGGPAGQHRALPVAVAQSAELTVGYLPGIAMYRIADLHPEEAQTAAKDAAIIAEAGRTIPHTVRSIAVSENRSPPPPIDCGGGGPGSIRPGNGCWGRDWTTRRCWTCSAPGRDQRSCAPQAASRLPHASSGRRHAVRCPAITRPSAAT